MLCVCTHTLLSVEVEEEHTDFLESNVKCTDKEVERFKELYPHFIGKSYYYTSKDFPEKM